MRTLNIFLAIAALLVGTSAGAAPLLTLSVLDAGGNSSGPGGVGMYVEITLVEIEGNGLGGINFDVETDGGALSNFVGSGFSSLAYSGAANGTNQLWDDGVAGPTDFPTTTILTFDFAGGGTYVTLNYPDSIVNGGAGNNTADVYFYAKDDLSFGYNVVVNPYTVAVIPEPTTAVLLGLGIVGLAVGGRRR